MKSNIDWNEIVPKLGEGLKQTLYLEAVKLINEAPRPAYKRPSQATPDKREYNRRYYAKHRVRLRRNRDYKAEYARRTGKTKRKEAANGAAAPA